MLRAEEIQITGIKTFTHFTSSSDAVELHFIHHSTSDQRQTPSVIPLKMFHVITLSRQVVDTLYFKKCSSLPTTKNVMARFDCYLLRCEEFRATRANEFECKDLVVARDNI